MDSQIATRIKIDNVSVKPFVAPRLEAPAAAATPVAEPAESDSLVVVKPPENPVKPFVAPNPVAEAQAPGPLKAVALEVAPVETRSSVVPPVEASVEVSGAVAMATPVPLEKKRYKAPPPRRKVAARTPLRQQMATPAPRQKVKTRIAPVVKNVKRTALSTPANVKDMQGFVLFLGSYRQSRASYLDTIIANLQKEPVDLIKQTVEINSALYTRLYAGPFADRNAAVAAKQALFDSLKITSSMTYLQPGASQFSRIERIARKVHTAGNAAAKRDYSAANQKKYVVRVGSYQNRGVNSSGNLLRRINALGEAGFQKSIAVDGKMFWRVYSGPYTSLVQAARARKNLRDKLSLSDAILMEADADSKWTRIDA